jgi:predicted aspartyl protease
MTILKQISTLALLVVTTHLWVAIAQAKPAQPKPANSNGCFMVDSTGKVINLSTLCGAEFESKPSGVYQARIKRRQGGIPIIDVVFSTKSGKSKFEMMVDTGASGTVITETMARRLGVLPVTKTRVSTASSNNIEVPLGYISSIEVNGAIVQDLLVAIIPSLEIGLLGHDFFGDFDITVKKDIVEFRIPSK